MKKLLVLVGVAVLLATCGAAFAQAPFADVPTDHWAYRAVEDLQERGLVTGYPDGTFQGKRALTRYEFAMVIYRLIPVLEDMIGTGRGEPGLQGPRGEQGPIGPKGEPGAPGNAADIEALRRLVNEFRDELATMGVDVDQLKRMVEDLNNRVTTLEERVDRFPEFSGNTDAIFKFSSVDGSTPGIPDIDNRFLAADNSLLEGASVLYNINLNTKYKVSDLVTANMLLNAGSYLPWLNRPSVGTNPVGVAADTNTAAAVTPWYLYIDAPISLGFLGGTDIKVGRYPAKLTKWTLWGVDTDSYTYNELTDLGNYSVNGGDASFKLGAIGIYAAFAQQNVSGGINMPFVGVGATPIGLTQIGLARATLGTPFGGTLGINYLNCGETTVGSRTQYYGADLNFNLFRGIGLSGSFTQQDPNNAVADPVYDNGIARTKESAWEANLAIPISSLNIMAGYTRIGTNYNAPGYWNRLGSLYNVPDIKGPKVNLELPLGNSFSLVADWEDYDQVSAVPAGLQEMQLTRWQAGLKFDLTSTNRVDLGYERVEFTPSFPIGAGKQSESFINIGFGHTFNPNTSVKVLYQIAEYKDGWMGLPDVKAGIAAAQFSVKF